jgi:hypothetical protein
VEGPKAIAFKLASWGKEAQLLAFVRVVRTALAFVSTRARHKGCDLLDACVCGLWLACGLYCHACLSAGTVFADAARLMWDPRAGAACQRQRWTLHKRQCRDLAEQEFCSTFGRRTGADLGRLLNDRDPPELPLLPKLSAITWTTRSHDSDLHVASLNCRARHLDEGRPVPGDTKEMLTRLLKRATTELPWPELPGGTEMMFQIHLRALTKTTRLGEPEAAVEVLSRHVEEIERKVVAPNHVAKYYIYRLDLLLEAAMKFEEDEGKRDAYVAEAKGLMGRATRSLRSLRPQDWDFLVRASISPRKTIKIDCITSWLYAVGFELLVAALECASPASSP